LRIPFDFRFVILIIGRGNCGKCKKCKFAKIFVFGKEAVELFVRNSPV